MKVSRETLLACGISLARTSFYDFCRLLYPKFYTPQRKHLKILCNTLQEFSEGKTKNKETDIQNLIINIPPRHGKSYTIQNFCKYLLGQNPLTSMIAVSYGQTLSLRTGKEVRDSISEKKVSSERVVFRDIFPWCEIKEGDGAVDLWATKGSHFSFLSTSPTGTMTGVGCKWLIIDDIVKNDYEANHEGILQRHYGWYTNTCLSRLEAGAKKLLLMTRWSTKDLVGRVLESEGDKWHVIKMPANCNGEMLDPSLLSFEEYEDRRKKTDPQIFMANYEQQPFDSVDRLYPKFKTYEKIPEGIIIHSYTDTADEGDNALVSYIYGVVANCAYILDIYYSKESMEYTEVELAKRLNEFNVEVAFIESNNGGRGFARNVEKILREDKNFKTIIKWFSQNENKKSRILSNATSVMNMVLFPVGWEYRYSATFSELASMGRLGKWKYDDAADSLTGVVEKSLLQNEYKVY